MNCPVQHTFWKTLLDLKCETIFFLKQELHKRLRVSFHSGLPLAARGTVRQRIAAPLL